jgi:hypothetical protein
MGARRPQSLLQAAPTRGARSAAGSGAPPHRRPPTSVRHATAPISMIGVHQPCRSICGRDWQRLRPSAGGSKYSTCHTSIFEAMGMWRQRWLTIGILKRRVWPPRTAYTTASPAQRTRGRWRCTPCWCTAHGAARRIAARLAHTLERRVVARWAGACSWGLWNRQAGALLWNRQAGALLWNRQAGALLCTPIASPHASASSHASEPGLYGRVA